MEPRDTTSLCGRRNPATLGLCSRCFREQKREAGQAAVNEKAAAAALCSSAKAAGLGAEVAVQPPAAEPEAKAEPAVQTPLPAPEASPAARSSAPGPSEADERPVQKNPGRCFSCGKRVGLTGFKCRCERVFCASHRCGARRGGTRSCTF